MDSFRAGRCSKNVILFYISPEEDVDLIKNLTSP
jgi:hypothetical protein